MDPLLGIAASIPPLSIGANGAVAPTSGLLASAVDFLAPGLFGGGASTVVELSGLGQLLSAAATFQDQLASLQPGTATSGGGQNFGTDVASLAAEAQSFVDAFNGLQNGIAAINGTGNLLGTGITGATDLTQALDTQVQANVANGESTLTRLSQLGIIFQPAETPGGGSRLSIDLGTLQSAFNADAQGAFSLLSQAANALGDVAGNFVGQAGDQFGTSGAQAQISIVDQLLNNNLLTLALSNGGFNLADLLAMEAFTQSNSGISAQQTILALNEFTLVSALLG